MSEQVSQLWVESDPVGAKVAENVRAEMARARVTGNRLPQLIGYNQGYWSRRIRGAVEFSGSDLVALARVLHVKPGKFFEGCATRDSNPEPAEMECMEVESNVVSADFVAHGQELDVGLDDGHLADVVKLSWPL